MLKHIQSLLKEKAHRRFVIAVSILLFVVLVLIWFRVQAAIALRNRTNDAAIRVVAVITAPQGGGVERIVLPGNVQAWHEATLYARTNGYIKKWVVDIGSHVKAGDLLAQIETPELDAQYRQSVADLNTAIANNKLAQSTSIRWISLLKTESVSKQETDEKVSAAKALAAAVIAAQANVDRLRELVGFERVIAPFDGIIVSRTTDIGALINEGSSTTGLPLFQIAQTNPLRIYVKVPQNYSSRIKPKMKVTLHFAEYANKEFPATLLETAHAIDPKTRTLLAQFVAENKSGELLSGAYTEVRFSIPISPHTVRLPANTLLFRAQGLQVATLDKNSRIVLKSVTISRDLGSEVEIATGVEPGEKIIINPPDSITSGEQVRVVSS